MKKSDVDGNLTHYGDTSENWRTVRANAYVQGALFPESVLSKPKQVMRHGTPPLQGEALIDRGFSSDFPLGVIRVVPRIQFVPEAVVGSGLFLF